MRRYRSLLFVLAVVGCEGVHRLLEAPPPPYIRLSLAVQPASLTIARGGEFTFTATVTRTGEDRGPVSVSVDSPPSGVTAETKNASTSGEVTTVVVVVRAATDAPVGAYTLTVRGHANEATDGTSVLILSVIDPPSYSLSLAKESLTIAHGGIARVGLALKRINLSSPVALSVAGQTGIGGVFDPNPFTGDSTNATITVGADVAPGSYTVSIRGSVDGLSDRVAPLSVNVIADPIQVIAGGTLSSPQLSTTSTEVIVNSAVSSGVVLSAEGLPAGAVASFDALTPGNPATKLRLDIGGATPAGTYPVVVRAKGTGVPDATATITLTVVSATIGLSVVPPAANVFTGAATTASLTVSRNNFGGAVTFSADALPAGVTVTFDSATIKGGATIATIAIAPTAAPGTYSIVLRATPVGLVAAAAKTGSVDVTIIAAPASGANVVLDWSKCKSPDWVAVQDGAGLWTRASGSGGVFGGAVSSAFGAIAWVENGTVTTVRYMTQAELASQPLDMCGPQAGPRVITGAAVHGTTTEVGAYSLGGGTGTSSASQPHFTITGVRDGVHDLLAFNSFSTGVPNRIVLRRDITVGPATDSVETVNFQGPEAFTPITLSPGINISGSVTAGEAYSTSTSYLTTAACTSNFLYASPPIALTGTGQLGFPLATLGLPATAQRPEDYYLVSILITGPSTLRTSSIAFHAAGPRSLAVGPVLSGVSVAAVPGAYKRLQATFGTIPTTFNRSVALQYSDALKSMTVSATVGYVAVAGTTLTMPELSDVSGWPSGAGIGATNSGSWRFTAEGSSSVGPACVENRVTYSSARTGGY